MSKTIYEDFSIKIEPKRGDSYPVIVLRSPAGEGRSSFPLPFDPGEIGEILFDLGQTVRGSGHEPTREISPAATRTGPQQIGDQLFTTLFSGSVRSLLDRSLGMIHGRQRGLRIKLHIDPEDPSLAQLGSLPWEYLYRKETRDFLNLSRFTPIIRYLDVQRPYTPLPLEPPLRILVIISNPTDYAPLNLDHERARIEASWARQESVEVEFIERATILALQDRLAGQPYHVLHYMGHGDFDERTGQGVLVMEDEGGQGALVDGSTLGVLLRDVPSMRLVFLNACETARVTKEKGFDPFAGVATAMVMAGIPAVVAMQFPITDRAAITFAQKIYPLLARGEPVDAAVAEGRRAIRLAESQTMEWGTPVLFMRAPEGVIFRVSDDRRAQLPMPQTPDMEEEIDEALEQRLTELYTRGLSAFWLEEWEKAARSFQAIVEARPDYEDAAHKLAEARRQSRLHALYAQALAAEEAQNWPGALAALEELAAEAQDFKDTAERLQEVRKRKQLADLYAEAQRLHQAEQWQAILNVFVQIQALDPEYSDPDGLLTTAKVQAAEQKRQAELNARYSQAVREMDARRWPEAQRILGQVREMEPGFRQVERLIARVEAEIEREAQERQRREQVDTLYLEAQELAGTGQWEQVLERIAAIHNLDPRFTDPQGIAARAGQEIDRQRRLEALYAEAQAARKAGDWTAALSVLEELAGQAPDDLDVPGLLEEAREKKKLADLYVKAGDLFQAEQWQAVAGTFAQIHKIEPEYPDPDELLPKAERAMASLKRQAALDKLYSRAIQEVEAENWTEARRLLAQVQELAPGYLETQRLLGETEAEIARDEAERQKQERIATSYEQAHGLARARQWQDVLAKIAEVQALEPGFADPQGLADRAKAELARQEQEAQRQSELAGLYAEAVRLLRAGQYQKALEKWGEVRAVDPRYPDRQKVQAKARRKLAALGRREVPRWAWYAGGVFVLLLAALGVWISCSGDDASGGFCAFLRPAGNESACLLPPAGVFAWWTGDGAGGDVIGGREVTFHGDAATGPGLVGQAFHLDGGGDYVSVSHDPAMNFGTGDFTIHLWVNFNDTSGEQVLVEKWIQRDRFSQGWTLTKLEGDSMRLVLADGTGVEALLDSYNLTLQPGAWYHVAATRQGSSVSLYLNGKQVASNPEMAAINTNATATLKFGYRGQPEDTPGSDATDEKYLQGHLDEVALYNGTALTAEQALALYQAGSAGLCAGALEPVRALNLRVNYGHNWVESFYEAGHTVWITVIDKDVKSTKASAQLRTAPREASAGETGFHTSPGDWDPALPDIEPYDWVFGWVDNGARAWMQVGEIRGGVNPGADRISGTINAPWYSEAVDVECHPWDPPGTQIEMKYDAILPDGSDAYTCSWVGEWDIQPQQKVDVGFTGQDGHYVVNSFIPTGASIVASIQGDWFWTTGFKPGMLTFSIYDVGGARLLWRSNREADNQGYVHIYRDTHGQDLVPGHYLVVSDGVTEKTLLLETVTIEVFDPENDIISGTAPGGREVRVTPRAENAPELLVVADRESGAWVADFTSIDFDLTEEMRSGSEAQIFDEDGDTNEIGL